MAAAAVKAFKPTRVYPYHTTSRQENQVPGFIKLMEGVPGVTIKHLK